MNYFRIILIATFLLIGSIGSARDRKGVIRQMQSLSAAPGSIEPTILPPDGRPWIVFIFKACCTPADHAARWIVATQEEYGDRVGVLGLNVDPGKSLQKVPNWLRMREIEFPVVSDPTAQVASAWGVIAPPAVVILDGNCHEVYRTMGYLSSYGTRLKSEIERLLQESSATEQGDGNTEE